VDAATEGKVGVGIATDVERRGVIEDQLVAVG
jgi:hypothetical protein